MAGSSAPPWRDCSCSSTPTPSVTVLGEGGPARRAPDRAQQRRRARRHLLPARARSRPGCAARGRDAPGVLRRARASPYDECGKLLVALDAGGAGRPRRDRASGRRANGVPGCAASTRPSCARSSRTSAASAALHSPHHRDRRLPARHPRARRRRRARTAATVRLGFRGDRHLRRDGDAVGVSGRRRTRELVRPRHRVRRACSPTASPGWPATPPSRAIVPFRGEYYRAACRSGAPGPRPDLSGAGPALPVPRRPPDPAGRRRASMVGPNAVLALAREGYRWGACRPRDAGETAALAGLPAHGAPPLAYRDRARCRGSLRKRRVRRRGPRATSPSSPWRTWCRPAPACARRRVDARRRLVDDFRIHRVGPVSPSATRRHRRPPRPWPSPSTSSTRSSARSGLVTPAASTCCATGRRARQVLGVEAVLGDGAVVRRSAAGS